MTAPDSIFDTLPTKIRRLIDYAFHNAMNPNIISTLPIKEGFSDHQVITQSGSGGGFITPNDFRGSSAGGGFIVEDTEPGEFNTPQEIPFSLIPSALQLLDLPPDDDEILAVLRNAASGWTSAAERPTGEDLDACYVNKEDWRSVCAVLLENRVSQGPEDGRDDSSQYTKDQEDLDVSMDVDYHDDESDIYNDTETESEDEYNPAQYQKVKAPRPKRQPSSVSPTDPHKSTSRQRQTCLEAFGLFFPDSSPENLPEQRIMMTDLQRVSTLIGEKTKTEELLEMLEIFSTSPDKAMNFDDFTRMMIISKLA